MANFIAHIAVERRAGAQLRLNSNVRDEVGHGNADAELPVEQRTPLGRGVQAAGVGLLGRGQARGGAVGRARMGGRGLGLRAQLKGVSSSLHAAPLLAMHVRDGHDGLMDLDRSVGGGQDWEPGGERLAVGDVLCTGRWTESGEVGCRGTDCWAPGSGTVR
jgi:hypothetical protein